MFEDVERDVVNDDGQVEKKKFRIAIPGYVSQKFFDGVHETRTYSYRYKIKARDIKLDLAILKTDTPLPPSEKSAISCKEPVRGDTVYAVGNPFVVLYATVTKGTVASVQRNYEQLGVTNGSGTYGQDNGLIQFTAPIAPGNSGGALYNDAGELIGVVVRGGNYTLGLGVPLSDVREFLKDNDAFVAYGVKKVCD
jgi:serine protease Do